MPPSRVLAMFVYRNIWEEVSAQAMQIQIRLLSSALFVGRPTSFGTSPDSKIEIVKILRDLPLIF